MQTYAFWNSAKTHEYSSYLPRTRFFRHNKINKTGCFHLNRTDIFSQQFAICTCFLNCGLQFANVKISYKPPRSFMIDCVFCCLWGDLWYKPPGILSNYTLYRTYTPTPRGKPCMTLSVYGVSKLTLRRIGESMWVRNHPDPPLHQAPLIHNHTTFKCCIAFLASQRLATCHPLFCLLSTYFLMRNAWLYG